MEKKQEREGKIKEKKGIERRGSKIEAKTNNATTSSVAEEATASSAGDNRAYSNGRNRKDECGGVEGSRTECRSSS